MQFFLALSQLALTFPFPLETVRMACEISGLSTLREMSSRLAKPRRETNMHSSSKFISVDATALPWEEYTTERVRETLFRKVLFTESETGVTIALVRYPAGIINPSHTHPCGHGLYVLEGRLVTHRGVFGPGTLVWFPEGEVMEHGAAAEGDLVALFVTNKSFRIDYIDAPSQETKQNV
jgi:quercetin dioxygenase-like cupin family protein